MIGAYPLLQLVYCVHLSHGASAWAEADNGLQCNSLQSFSHAKALGSVFTDYGFHSHEFGHRSLTRPLLTYPLFLTSLYTIFSLAYMDMAFVVRKVRPK